MATCNTHCCRGLNSAARCLPPPRQGEQILPCGDRFKLDDIQNNIDALERAIELESDPTQLKLKQELLRKTLVAQETQRKMLTAKSTCGQAGAGRKSRKNRKSRKSRKSRR